MDCLGGDKCGIKREGTLEKGQENDTLKHILMGSFVLILRRVSERPRKWGDAERYMQFG